MSTLSQMMQMMVSGAATYAALDPAHKGSLLTLSSGNLIATRGSAGTIYQSVLATLALSGNIYWEMGANSTGTTRAPNDNFGSGIATSSMSLASATVYTGSSSSSCAVWDDGGVTLNGAVVTTESTKSDPWVWRFAFKSSTRELWIGDTDNGWITGDPGTGVSPVTTMPAGTYYPAATVAADAKAIGAFNFGATSFAGTIPSGFTGLHT